MTDKFEQIYKKAFDISNELLAIIRMRDEILIEANSAFIHACKLKNDAIGTIRYSQLNLFGKTKIVDFISNFSLKQIDNLYEDIISVPDSSGNIITLQIKAKQITIEEEIYFLLSIRPSYDLMKIKSEFDLYTEIYKNVNTGIIITTSDGTTIEMLNQAVANMHGYTIEELKNKSYHTLISKNDLETYKKAEEDSLTRTNVHYEANNQRKDGTLFAVSIYLTTLTDKSGKITCRYINIHNIQDRKRAERQLLNIKMQQQAILDNLPYMAWLKDTDGRFQAVNKFFVDAIKRPINQIIGKTDRDLYPLDLAEKYQKDDQKVIQNRNQKLLEEQIILPDGVHWIETFKTPIFDSNKRVIGTTGVARDITQRKLTEERINKSLRQHELLREISYLFISPETFEKQITKTLEIIGKNTAVSRVYIFENKTDNNKIVKTFEWCNLGVEPQVDSLDVFESSFSSDIIQLVQSKEIICEENIHNLPANLHRNLETLGIISIMLLPLFIDNRIIGFIGFDECLNTRKWDKSLIELIKTISNIISNGYRRRELHKNLVDAKIAAEQASIAKSQFLANMSHEIRTPMNGILGISKMLIRYDVENLNDRQKEGLKIINESGERLLGLINDILDLSKVEAGKMDVQLSNIEFISLIQSLENTINPLIKDKKLHFKVEILNDVPNKIISDPNKIYQILINLIGNAVKFTEKGEIILRISQKDNFLWFEISDTGIGIKKEDLSLVFEEFRQLEESASRTHKGTGLGLAICKKLVELLKGTIQIESEPGKGTTVKFCLPIQKPVETRMLETPDTHGNITLSSAENQDNPAPSVKQKILIADSEEIGLATFKYILERHYDLYFARNGHEALALYFEIHPNAVLTDVMLPQLDGFRLLDEIRNKEKNKTVPIIAVTARTMKDEKKKILAYGFDGFISKPINDEILISTIQKLLLNNGGNFK
jgi:PAS domain S-box-containing protein